MKKITPTKCPVCNGELHITKLECSACNTGITGKFPISDFSRLSLDDIEFLKIFIRCRGNIKDVERLLDISYPTVRNKLDNLIMALGFDVKESDSVKDKESEKVTEEDLSEKRRRIINDLENGKITPDDAIRMLKELGQ